VARRRETDPEIIRKTWSVPNSLSSGELVERVPGEGLAGAAGLVAVDVVAVAGKQRAAVAATSDFLELVGGIVDVGFMEALPWE